MIGVRISAGRLDRRGNCGDPLAFRAKEMVKLPAVDRIFTITEGQGITGALCGGMPCAIKEAAGKPAAPDSPR